MVYEAVLTKENAERGSEKEKTVRPGNYIE